MNEKAVFISYNHKNTDLKEKLELKLPQYCDGISVVTDSKAKAGKQLHKEVSRLINSAQIVIPIITKEWLSSHETRDELVRAHERRKFIVCFLFSEDFKTNDDLPFYLREMLRVHFTNDNLEQKIRELADSISAYHDYWKRELFDEIRVLGDYLDEFCSELVCKKEHLYDAFKRARGEISQIVHKEQFNRKVSYEDNFLRSASPYFRSASSILAVSIATISTFWDNTEAYDAVNGYLAEQADENKTVIRLFVFRDPIEANYFKNILQANYRAYGKSGGGVFMTSWDGYQTFLNEVSRDQSFLRRIEGRDFGILLYKSTGRELALSAILDPHELMLEEIDMEDTSNNSYKSFVSATQSMLSIAEGKIGRSLPCVRWSNDYYKFPEQFADGLKKIFKDEYGPILHLVLVKSIRANRDDVRDALHQLKARFEHEGKVLELDGIWLRERKDVLAHDGRFLGRLITNKTYDFVLGLEFENEKALQSYYQHRMHSVERERLYSILCPDVKPLFERMNNQLQQVGKEAEIEKTFTQIEEKLKRYIVRLDMRLHQQIDNIVNLPGAPFGSKYNV